MLMTLEELLPAIGPILQAVQKVEPKAVVAGGCLRDAEHGKPIKDIDVFIPLRDWGDLREVVKRITDELGVESSLPLDFTPYQEWNGEVIGVHQIRKDGLNIELIALAISPDVFSWETCVSRMDMGLCQIAFTGTCVFCSQYYSEDAQAKRFSVHRDCLAYYSEEATLARFDRLSLKYPEYPLIIYDGDHADCEQRPFPAYYDLPK
jgi:hypothetical protein